MIDELSVRNVALIEEATLMPSAGFTVITGETGAGKTALLSACKLLMGQRAAKEMVREGTSEASAEGRFYVSGADDDEAGVVASRTVSSDGRSRARINGSMASVKELSEVIAPTIELCSQHDQRLLDSSQAQRSLLDSWAQTQSSGLLDAYRSAFDERESAAEALEALKANKSATDAQVQEAKRRLARIDALSPSKEDYDELVASLSKSENAEMLMRQTGIAHDSLSSEGGALDQLNGAIAALEDACRVDDLLSEQVRAIREALFVVEDVSREVSRYADAIEVDVASIALMQERVAAYQGLMREFGPSIDDVLKQADQDRRIVEANEDSEDAEQRAKDRLFDAQQVLKAAGNALFKSHAKAASTFSEKVTSELSSLAMGTAEVICKVDELEHPKWTRLGPDRIEFLFRPAREMQVRPLARIASGGELGRTMLAIYTVLGELGGVDTLVFDEVDAGVGGSVAISIGDAFARLAKRRQVIVISHLAQVAARADKHFVVSKHEDAGVATTTMGEVVGDSRIDEVARMLSGNLTEASIAHAKELLFGT